jgi:glycosyltransferase involved in cell wall biosynthesis
MVVMNELNRRSFWFVFQRPVSHSRLLVGNVILICPGGLEHGGGIGRQMGYFLEARQQLDTGPTYRVVDSRGPWFLGASPMHIGFAISYLIGASLKLLKARAFSTPCVIHANVTGRGSTVRKVLLLAFAHAIGLRYLLHVHDYNYAEDYARRGALMRGLIAMTFRRAIRVITLGQRDKEALAELLHLPRQKMIVLHNAVPDPLQQLTGKAGANDHRHILFLGHLSARKGVPDLLRALARPELAARQWRVTMAGGGPIAEFQRLAQDLGIGHRVDFPGWLDASHVQALCADADVLVLPSHAEGLAMAVLEGLANGLAVITTPVGAHSEVIEPEVSGLLIAAGDVEALSSALVRVIDDGDLRQRLRAGARRRFLEKFDVRSYAVRLSQLHASLFESLERSESRYERVAN